MARTSRRIATRTSRRLSANPEQVRLRFRVADPDADEREEERELEREEEEERESRSRQQARSRRVLSNSSRRTSRGSDMRRIEDAARAAGWDVEQTKMGHLVFRSPDKTVPPLYTGSNIGDPRTLKNIEALLRRHGLDLRTSKVKRNPLKPEDRRLLARLEETCGPAEEWHGRCSEIAEEASQLTGFPTARGHYRGAIDPFGFWRGRAHVPFVQHSWVKLPGDEVLDPTRFSFEDADPYIHVGSEQPDYDEGGQIYRAERLGSVPSRHEPSTKKVTFKLVPAAAAAVEQIFGPGQIDLGRAARSRKVDVTITSRQAFYLANLSMDALAPFTFDIYRAFAAAGRKGLIPIDNWRRAEREHAGAR